MRYLKDKNNFFLREHQLTSRECYEYYKKHRKWNSPTINQYNYFVKALEGFFIIVQKMMIQSEGGVYLRGLGYFACVLTGKKRKTKFVKTKSLVVKTKRPYKYVPYFFPEEDMKKWTMEDTFMPINKDRINASKINHKLHFDICRAYKVSEAYANKLFQHRAHKGEFKFDENDI